MLLSKVFNGWPLVYARLVVILLALTAVPLNAANLPVYRKAEPLAKHDSIQLAQITNWLKANGGNPGIALRVADAIQKNAREAGVEPLLVVGIIGVENNVLKTTARSGAGARGIMQVMPHWRSTFRNECGSSLTNIETNICFGVRILKLYINEAPSLRSALLRYNGCTTGACTRYPSQVFSSAGKAVLTTIPAGLDSVTEDGSDT